MRTTRDWNLVTLGVMLTLIVILIGRALWTESDRMLERAKQEYTACLNNAPQTWKPESAVRKCEREWKKAQDDYYIP